MKENYVEKTPQNITGKIYYINQNGFETDDEERSGINVADNMRSFSHYRGMTDLKYDIALSAISLNFGEPKNP